ncbi:peptidase domain-containing ABC transporter [Klebsiella oxytoca]|uniref:peptidase domain-containing ABC transporter n=1 Tax=Klebsiella oxytoca TaxID=571 RepID=UPI0007CBFA4A|nr:peptidase domain-containing ABC transporter [Klebsiella oxytoca]SAQ55567.1 MceG [Klebsiella oxytoca]
MNNNFNTLLHKIDLGFKSRFPMIHQTESSECGLACLAMICGYYGKNIDIFSLRQKFNLSSRGSDLSSLNNIAHKMNMSTRAVSVELNELNSVKLPCVLHWEFNHFVVLTKIKNNKYIIHDPSTGILSVNLNEISNKFTGIALEIWPDNGFSKSEVKNKISLRSMLSNTHGIYNVLIKIFLLSLVIESINLVMPVATQLVMDHAIPANDLGLLTLICIGLIFFVALRTVTGLIRSWTALVMSSLINAQWQVGLLRHLMMLPLEYFERRKLGDIQSRFGSLDTLRETFTTSIVGAIIDSIMVIGLLIMLVLYGGWLTWIVILFTTLYSLIRIVTYNRYRQLSEELLIKEARASSFFMETLYGIATIKVQGLNKRRENSWFNLEIDSINTGIKVSKLNLFFGGVNTLIATVDQISILWLGASLVITGNMTIGMFVAFSSFRGQFSDRVSSLIDFLLRLQMMSLHNERVSDIALTKAIPFKDDIFSKNKMVPVSLVAKNISYKYDNYSEFIFKDLNINILPGEHVAITGSSGTGKTTLMKVLCGLFPANKGNILVDGIDINELGINNYQKIISCVLQDDRLFSGSLRENITAFSADIDDNWMVECAKFAQIHDDIEKMSMGYDTLIGELGEGLSGGQKQRIFIARAIYKKPSVIFMDEATSSLDHENENYINHAIKSLKITRIVIAHRESTIKAADRIISLGEHS